MVNEITETQKIGKYWPYTQKRALTLTIILEVLLSLILTSSLFLAGVITTLDSLIITLISTLVATILLNLFLVRLVLEPLAEITAALTHISGEPTTVIPPNPNSKHFERDGLKPLLQLIYSISASRNQVTTKRNTVDLNDALDDSPVGLVILNNNRQIIYHNQSSPVKSDADGSLFIDLIFNDRDNLATWLDEVSDKAVHADKVWRRIANNIPGEEDRKIYDINVSFQKGKQAETIMTLFDRTGEYQPEDDDLDFIAFAAHELRGPITVIKGYLDVLTDELNTVVDSEQIELMTRLIVSANRLSSYINNILNASRYDRRHLKLRLREVPVTSIYDSIRDDMELRASSQRRILNVNISNNLPTVAADLAASGEVLGNLLDNAIKYSHDGGVIDVTAEAAEGFVTISVEDHGIGMPDQVIGNLFHKFYRSHRSRETVAGTGIGLYISKSIVESHGGTISVKSTEGVGSTFTFSLPIYSAVAEKLNANDNSNEHLISKGDNWIKNHTMFRG